MAPLADLLQIAFYSQVSKVSKVLSRLKESCLLRVALPRLYSWLPFGATIRNGIHHSIGTHRSSFSLLVRHSGDSSLAVSMLYFHVIGWLHKGFNSPNVLLFRRKSGDSGAQTRVRYDQNPHVCGFDYSRPNEAGNWLTVEVSLEKNIYRHPERWTRPVRYQMQNDIYAHVCIAR